MESPLVLNTDEMKANGRKSPMMGFMVVELRV
jgi:hypothetical protein